MFNLTPGLVANVSIEANVGPGSLSLPTGGSNGLHLLRSVQLGSQWVSAARRDNRN
jgi:hypothetical protein